MGAKPEIGIKGGKLSPLRQVPVHIARPEYVGKLAPTPFTGSDIPRSEVVEVMRAASKIAANALVMVGRSILPGVSTDFLDKIGHEYLCDHGAYPSTLGYRGFPKSLCSSINEVICHGIPDSREILPTDIVNIDITAFLTIDGVGAHGDTNATFLASEEVDDASYLLVERTEAALARAIATVLPGRESSVIGRVIESYAKRFNYGVVHDFTGHGINTAFHSNLIIPHYDTPRHAFQIEEGMTFTIEPMLTLGTYQHQIWDDGWTVVTTDGKRSAQFEHTLLVTATGAEILTLPTI